MNTANRVNAIGRITAFTPEGDTKIRSIDDITGKYDDFNFRVNTVDMEQETGDMAYNGFRALRREDTGQVFGFVKGRYTAIQNEDIFKPFNEIVNENGAHYTAGGVIGGGKKVWMQAELDKPMIIGEADVVKSSIILMIDHAGTGSNAILPFTSRVACTNQFGLISRAAKGFKVRHSINWEDSIEETRVRFNSAMGNNRQFEKLANQLARLPFTGQQFKEFAGVIMPDVKPNKYAPEGRNMEKKRDVMQSLFFEGMGNKGRTKWDAFNAVTEYFDHYQGAMRLANAEERQADTRGTYEARFLNTLNSGMTNRIKSKALDLLKA